jgi:hypothetical protein
MAIYTNWGSQIKIIENCGKPKPKGFKFPATLVKIRYEDDGRERYAFAEFLRADNGAVEIDQAVRGLQAVILDGETLKKAIQQAL